MDNFKTVTDLPIFDNLYKTFEDMVAQGIIEIPAYNQVCLNAPKGFEDDYKLGTGSLYIDWSKVKTSELTSKKELPCRERIFEEHEFTELCTIFKNTPFEELYNSLKSKYTLGRVRIMISLPKTCLSWHTDSSLRIHYPIKTQEGCFMVIGNEIYHLPINEWTLTNTTVKHTIFNGSFDKRVHIVASILNEN